MTCKPRTWVLYARWRLSHGQLEPADPTNFLRELGVEPADAMRGYEGWSKHLEEVVRLSEEVDDALGVTQSDGIVSMGWYEHCGRSSLSRPGSPLGCPPH